MAINSLSKLDKDRNITVEKLRAFTTEIKAEKPGTEKYGEVTYEEARDTIEWMKKHLKDVTPKAQHLVLKLLAGTDAHEIDQVIGDVSKPGEHEKNGCKKGEWSEESTIPGSDEAAVAKGNYVAGKLDGPRTYTGLKTFAVEFYINGAKVTPHQYIEQRTLKNVVRLAFLDQYDPALHTVELRSVNKQYPFTAILALVEKGSGRVLERRAQSVSASGDGEANGYFGTEADLYKAMMQPADYFGADGIAMRKQLEKITGGTVTAVSNVSPAGDNNYKVTYEYEKDGQTQTTTSIFTPVYDQTYLAIRVVQ